MQRIIIPANQYCVIPILRETNLTMNSEDVAHTCSVLPLFYK